MAAWPFPALASSPPRGSYLFDSSLGQPLGSSDWYLTWKGQVSRYRDQVAAGLRRAWDSPPVLHLLGLFLDSSSPVSLSLCIPGILYKCIVCLCVADEESNNWHLVITTRIFIVAFLNRLYPVPVACRALLLITFFCHFANGETEAENSPVTNSRSCR